jgi:stage V sporulation protein SpoVS
VSLPEAEFEKVARALAFRLREAEDAANAAVGGEAVRGQRVLPLRGARS